MAAARRSADRFRAGGRFRYGCWRAFTFRCEDGHGTAHGDQHYRTCLGRQPGVVYPQGRRGLCRLATDFCCEFFRFYLAMFLVLLALIVRPVAVKYRSKGPDSRWRFVWDWVLFAGGAIPTLIFGVAVGNVPQGVPFHLTEDQFPMYEGTFYWKFLGLLNPFALLCGVVSFTILLAHDAAWISLKSEGVVVERARRIGSIAGMVAMASFALADLWLAFGIDAYQLTHQPAANGGNTRRKLACCLYQTAVNYDRATAGLRRHGVDRAWPDARPRGLDVACLQARHIRYNLNGRADDVPLHLAKFDRPEIIAHGLG